MPNYVHTFQGHEKMCTLKLSLTQLLVLTTNIIEVHFYTERHLICGLAQSLNKLMQLKLTCVP